MDKGKLCYACLLPKDVCLNKKCNFEGKVPESVKVVLHGLAPRIWLHSQFCSVEIKIMRS